MTKIENVLMFDKRIGAGYDIDFVYSNSGILNNVVVDKLHGGDI